MKLRPTKLRITLFFLLLGCKSPLPSEEGRGGPGGPGGPGRPAGPGSPATHAGPGTLGTGARLAPPRKPGPRPVMQTVQANDFALQSDGQASRQAWFDLTSSDGAGLVAAKLEIKTVIEGPLAFTELHLYFDNPEARVREGKFRITLPDGAAISRFAMENNGQLVEAEMVEKQKARVAYEDFLHRRQDPALLEQAAGNEFSARVFPILANAQKHLVISFSQTVTTANLRLPLIGLPQLQQLTAEVQLLDESGKYRVSRASKANWKPDADLVVAAPGALPGAAGGLDAAAKPGAVAAVIADDMAAINVAVTGTAAPFAPKSLAILIDTSGSRALGFANDLDRLTKLIANLRATLGDATPLEVIAFDQTAARVFAGPIGTFGAASTAAIAKRGALGASDLASALATVQAGADKQVIVISDAVATVGEPASVSEAIAKLKTAGVVRVDAVMVGGIRDSVMAETMATTLPQKGATLDADRLGVDEVARRLGQAMVTDVPIAIAGAAWVYPQTISGQPGDHEVVYARIPALTDGTKALTVTVGGGPRAVAAITVPAPLVSRSLAQAQIAMLEATLKSTTDASLRASLKAQLVAESVRHRVLSSATSLLVLESDADYARFGIARDALSDVLLVGTGGIDVNVRAKPPSQIATTPAAGSGAQVDPWAVDKRTQSADDGTVAANVQATGDVSDPDRDVDHDLTRDEADKEARDEASGAKFGNGRSGFGPGGGGRASGGGESGGVGRAMASAEGQMGRRDAPSDHPAPAPDPAAAATAAAALPMAPESRPAPITRRPREADIDDELAQERDADGRKRSPLTGDMANVMALLNAKSFDAAAQVANQWHAKAPGDVLGLLAIGEVAEAVGDYERAARAYGSLIDMFADRADLRRFAGQRLQRLLRVVAGPAQDAVLALVIDSFKQAVADRPDHPSSHRMLAFAYARAGQYQAAFEAIMVGVKRRYPDGRFRGADRVLKEDAGILAAAWLAAAPDLAKRITQQASDAGVTIAAQASTRFVLYWETDANDVDFHIRDARGGHAYYSRPELGSGGELFADITTGYGPECFAINGVPKAGPYRLSIHYYSRGPMGYGMGAVETLRYDGNGKLAFETRPYLVMVDGAFVELGSFQ